MNAVSKAHNGLATAFIHVFGKSLFQPEYRILKKALEEKLPKEAVIRLFDNQKEIQKLNVSPSALIEEMANNLNKKSDIDCKFYETSHNVPDPKKSITGLQ